jgi:MinD superfamily P-loop ATPase
VIASIGGASAVLIVAEPTVSGKHDMVRVAQLAEHFQVPAMVCVNKYDLNPEQGEIIEEVAREKGLKVLGRIPFDPVFTKAMVQAQTVVEYDSQSQASRGAREIWERLRTHMQV